MARPKKDGLDYFNLDTDRYQDMRIKRLKKNFKCTGIAVYDYILCEIYRVRGCFLEWDENTTFDVADYFGLKESTVAEIVNYCCAVGLFDKELLTSERILTSAAIQKRYFKICKDCNRTVVVPTRYLIKSEETPVKSEETPVKSEETPVKSEESTQRKGKKRKLKEIPPLPHKFGGGCDLARTKTPRELGTNPRAQGTNPRAVGENPRELGTNPRALESPNPKRKTDSEVPSESPDPSAHSPPEDGNDDEKLTPFEELKWYWNLKAKNMTKVKMSKMTQLIASPTLAHRLLCRIEEYGDEAIIFAIDRIADAEWWYGKTLGVETFLKDDIFPRFLNGEYKTDTNKR